MQRTVPWDLKEAYANKAWQKRVILGCGLLAVLVAFVLSLMVGSSWLSIPESFLALFGQGTSTSVRIVQAIRLPRALAALLAGAGLALAGLIMQSTLGNIMASPSVLGVSNAAVFGANVSIIAFAGGFLSTGHNIENYGTNANPFATSAIAFVFALLSVMLILGLCRLRSFSPNTVILAGLALGAVWTAGTTILQFYATDVGLSAAVIWSFGDLGRASFTTDAIVCAVVAASGVFFYLFRYKYNALLGGSDVASSVGVKVDRLRFVSLLIASLLTAVCVSFYGIIGFVGLICPHAMRRIIGNDHRFLIPGSLIAGSFLLLVADILSRVVANGSALPVGAITALLGAPFFLYLIFARQGERP